MTGAATQTANRPWGVVAILALFLGLAVFYNVITPLYESPDELQHAAMVVWLADGQRMPVLDAEDPGPWMQEATQPPLYYLVVASLTGWLPHDAADDLAKPNPYASLGVPLRPDNKNRVLHDMDQERWPYRAGVLSTHLMRLVSTLMALGTLWAIYRLGRITFPDRPGIALGMMGLVAFTPQFLFLSASINNDNLVILIASWVLVLLASWLSSPGLPSWLQVVTLGILLGLAALAKLSGVLLWPLAAGTMTWLAWRARNLRWLILAGLAVLGLALALSGWWFVRNQILYGDITGTAVHLQVMGRTPRSLPYPWSAILAEFNGLRYSFWALFGWFNVLAPDPFYWILDGLAILGLAGFVVFSIRSLRHSPRSTREIVVLLIVWLGLVAVALLRWTIMALASQGRLLYPAFAAIALILVVGWAELVPRRIRRPLGIAALAVWAVCAALIGAFVLRPAYALPERYQSFDELGITPTPLQVRFEDCCQLVGYDLPGQPVNPGDWVPLTLIWQALEPVEEDYGFYIHARTADGELVGQLDTFHGNGMYPTSQWRPGEIVVDTVQVPISFQAEGPAVIRLNVGLSDPATAKRLPAFAQDGTKVDTIFAGEVALTPAEWPRPQPDAPVDTVLGEQIRLSGVDLPQTEVQPGDVVTVTLQWEALDWVAVDYTGFVHLVDLAGNEIAQADHPPLDGRYPTHLWSPGTVVWDPYRLELPEDLAEGSYELLGGLYYPGTLERLPAIAQQRLGSNSPQPGERWRDDLVHLGTLTISPTE
jgi:4-amino-4-deoxy-L-arabinose transferase-like glycosyltransferase